MGLKQDTEFIYREQKELSLLGSALALLGWDQQTYMPKKGVGHRAEQSALIARMVHERFVSKKLELAAKRVAESKPAKTPKKARIAAKRLYKDILKEKKLPPKFVEEMIRTTTIAQKAWEEAKQKKKWKIFQPHMEKIVKLSKKKARLIGLKGHPYNSLLDDFEEEMTVEKIEKTFSELEPALLQLLKKIKKSKKYRQKKFGIVLDEKSQKQLAKNFVEKILPKDSTRADNSVHPFTTRIGPNDTRITTNYKRGFLFSFYSTIHESGHALYETSLPKQYKYTAIYDGASLGLHESQSRLWENCIGKSDSFLKQYYPMVKKLSKKKPSFGQWKLEANRVEPGLVRVEADEVHYCLHIIMRFELEKALIDGSLKAKDLPKEWNRLSKKFFGKKPKNDAEGVLQDVHWSGGAIGYFPTYAIGTIYAAQLYSKMKKEIKGFEGLAEKGEYEGIAKWLQKKIHCFGRKMPAEQVIKKACGKGLSAEEFLEYLEEKYSKIYC